MSKRNGFILYQDSWPLVKRLTDEQRGVLLYAVFAYDAGEELPEMDGMTELVFLEIKGKLDKNAEAYEAVVERNRENGKSGGRPQKPKKPSGLSENPKNPVGFEETQKSQREREIKLKEKEIKEKDVTSLHPKRKAENGPLSFPELMADSPELNQDFVKEAWDSYAEMRKKIHKPIATYETARLCAKKLKKLSAGDPIRAVKILEQSIENSWQGLFELRPEGNKTGRNRVKELLEA